LEDGPYAENYISIIFLNSLKKVSWMQAMDDINVKVYGREHLNDIERVIPKHQRVFRLVRRLLEVENGFF
jgi:hypothetical protein